MMQGRYKKWPIELCFGRRRKKGEWGDIRVALLLQLGGV